MNFIAQINNKTWMRIAINQKRKQALKKHAKKKKWNSEGEGEKRK